MRNTSITEPQYNLAKELIEIMNFYDPKEKGFIVQNSEENKL